MKIQKEEIGKILFENGFSQNEVEVYLSLLSLGPTNAAELAETIQMDKSSCYRAAKSLKKNGLITQLEAKYDSKLEISDISRLKSLFEKKKQQAEKDLDQISNFVENLPSFIQSEYLKSNVRIYEGQDAFDQIYSERIKESHPIIREISSDKIQGLVNLNNHSSKKYWDDMIRKRKTRGSLLKMLIDETDKSTHYHRTSKEQFKEVRILPNDFKISSGINIFGDFVAFHNANSEKIMGVIIQDKSIANILADMFDFMWNRAREV